MKTVATTLGVARSNLIERRDQARPRRGPQTRAGDVELADQIRRLVDQRPTYGYRRIAALLKRERRTTGLAPVNAKRVYRLMRKHGLLLARDVMGWTARAPPQLCDDVAVEPRLEEPSHAARCCDRRVGPGEERILSPRDRRGRQGTHPPATTAI